MNLISHTKKIIKLLKSSNTDNTKLVSVSISPDTFFESGPFYSSEEYMELQIGDILLTIGFNIDVNFDTDTDSGDDYLTPSFDEITNIDITLDIIDLLSIKNDDEIDIDINEELNNLLIETLRKNMNICE